MNMTILTETESDAARFALIGGLGAALNAGLPLMGRTVQADTAPKRQFTVDAEGHITVLPAP